MRKASFGLGLAGGIVAVCLGLYNILQSFVFKALPLPFFGHNSDFFWKHAPDEGLFGTVFEIGIAINNYYWPATAITIAAGVLGIVGACLIKKKNKAAGILILIAASMCIIGYFHSEVAGLLIPAGILALIKPKTKELL